MKKFNNSVNNILPFIDILLAKKGGKIKIPVSDIYDRMYQNNYDKLDAQKFVRKFRAHMNSRGYNVDVSSDSSDDIIIITDSQMIHVGDEQREVRRQMALEYRYNEQLYQMMFGGNENMADDLEGLEEVSDEKDEESDLAYNIILTIQEQILMSTGIKLDIAEIMNKLIKDGLKNDSRFG